MPALVEQGLGEYLIKIWLLLQCLVFHDEALLKLASDGALPLGYG